MSSDDDATAPAGVEDYGDKTVDDCLAALEDATTDEVAAFLDWERDHKDRKTLVQPLEKRLESAEAAGGDEDEDQAEAEEEQDDGAAVTDVGPLDDVEGDDETGDGTPARDDPSPFAEVAADGPDAQATQPGAEESSGDDSEADEATDPLGDIAEELEEEDWTADGVDETATGDGTEPIAGNDDGGAAALEQGAAGDSADDIDDSADDVDATPDAVDDTADDIDTTADAVDDTAEVADADDPQIDPDAPLGGLADELAREDEAAATPEEDPFEEVDVGELDAEEVWEEVVEGDGVDAPPPGAGVGPATESEDLPEHVVDKREYCQRCPHFAEPPDSTCAHEGTEIVEVVDSDHFRVRNCPIVQEAEFGPSPE